MVWRNINGFAKGWKTALLTAAFGGFLLFGAAGSAGSANATGTATAIGIAT